MLRIGRRGEVFAIKLLHFVVPSLHDGFVDDVAHFRSRNCYRGLIFKRRGLAAALCHLVYRADRCCIVYE